ncbi:MAG TPA: four helix bundle protein [Chthoniobacterales bacterium]|jgi:four helix bundle protein
MPKTAQLRKRTFDFGIRIVKTVRALPRNEEGKIVGRQLLRAGTSVGANYRATARARSNADFVAKLGIVGEECDETSYWLVVAELGLFKPARLTEVLREADELLSITVASIKTARGRSRT